MKAYNEKSVMLISVIFLIAIFGYAAYTMYNPPIKQWEAKIFDYYYLEKSDTTRVLSYKNGSKIFEGKIDFEIGETYLVKYKELGSYRGIIVSMEKIS